jgi:uncharacterized protein (DUF697 family)
MSFPRRLISFVVFFALVGTSTTVVSPWAVAGPSPGLCPMNTSRGAVPDDFAIDACVDGSGIWLRNQLKVAVRFTVAGDTGPPVAVHLDNGLAATATRHQYPDPLELLPGDIVRIPIGPGAASARLAASDAGGFYALATTLAAFSPLGFAGRVVNAFTAFVAEIADIYGRHADCLVGKNWIGQLGCFATLARDAAVAVARASAIGLGGAVLATIVSTVTFLGFVDAQPQAVQKLLKSNPMLSQAAITVLPSPSSPPSTHDTTNPPPSSPEQPASSSISLSQGGPAPFGSWYSVSLSGFAPGSQVTVTCRDSVDPEGFWTQTFAIDGGGTAGDSTLCYSADGPDHWVTSDGVESNHVSWSAAPPPPPSSSISLSQGGPAPFGSWYSVSLSGFAPGSQVTVTCRDSVDPEGFWTQTFAIDGGGTAGDSTLCYSADGPDHWVTSDGVESNHVSW